MVVDLDCHGVVGKHRKVRRHDCRKLGKKKGIALGIVPCPLKEVIVDKEVDAKAALVRLPERMIKADPFQAFVQMDRLDDRDAVGTGELGDAQVKVVPVTL